MVARKTRHSSLFPGLTLELERSERGTFATFKGLGMWATYRLFDGLVSMVDCSDRGRWESKVRDHVMATARAYAERFSTKATGKGIGAAWAA